MKYSSNFKMLKSALKKPSLVSSSGGRRVTFCKMVQVYTNSSLKPHEKLVNFESSPRPVIKSITFESLFSKHLEPEQFDFDSNDEPTDFFVHKVVYDEDNLSLSDSSEDLKIADEENNEDDSDSEKEEFIVHQVVRQNDEDFDESGEDDLDKSVDHTTNMDHEIICELSVQNIEQHNKLLDGDLLPNDDDPIVVASIGQVEREIILLPPLQELGVSRLICPQSDDWFWNLDISPLNSVQETDSDSNISSEDTMIMMTSEECAKNEQRIQESLQKFESLKKKNTQDDSKSEPVSEEHVSVEVHPSSSSENCENTISSTGEFKSFETESESNSLSSDTSSRNLDPAIQENKELCDSTNTCDASIASSMEEKPVCDSALPPYRGRLNSWDKDLTAIEIPKDVREWKICINKESGTKLLPSTDVELNDGIESKVREDQIKTECSVNEHCVDELEHFADQCTERVERIRKRYSINENMLWTPRRGIRPRFGSSAEILQHVPSGNHLLLSYAANSSSHYSWPYYDSADQQEHDNLQTPDTIGLLTNFLDELPHTSLPDLDSYHFRQQPVERLEHLLQDNDANCVSTTNELAYNEMLPPFDERGTPEGASPPRLSSESLCDSEKLELSKSVVYYSMEV